MADYIYQMNTECEFTRLHNEDIEDTTSPVYHYSIIKEEISWAMYEESLDDCPDLEEPKKNKRRYLYNYIYFYHHTLQVHRYGSANERGNGA